MGYITRALGDFDLLEGDTDVDRARFKGIPWHDVTAYGAIGNGTTDDTAAVQAAADAATPHGILYVPSDAVVRLSNTIDIDLGLTDSEVSNENPPEQNRFAIVCDGAFTVDAGTDGIHLHHGMGPQVFARFEGGGDSANPTANRALRVSDMLGGYYEGVARGYEGEVFSFDNGTSNVYHQSIGRLYAFECGRTLHLDDRNGLIVGFGQIGDVWEKDPAEGSIIAADDVNLDQWENLADRTNTPLTFNGRHHWVDKVAVGGSTTATLCRIEDSDESSYNNIFAWQGNGDGLVIDSSARLRVGAYTGGLGGAGVKLDQTMADGTGLNEVWVQSYACDGPGLQVTSNVTGDQNRFRGSVVDCAQGGGAGLDIQSTAPRTFLDHFLSYCGAGTPTNDANFASGNGIQARALDVGRAAGVSGSVKIENGAAEESSNAETPQGTYPVGTLVDFTDSGDGSGTGQHWLAPDGTWKQLA